MLGTLAADTNVAQNVGFGVIAVMMVVAAIGVVSTRNVVHGALWLVIVLAGAAAQYILAAAEFVAVSQVLVYIGAVTVLFLFGIMLTRAQVGAERNLNNTTWPVAIPVAVLMLGVLSWAIIDSFHAAKLPTTSAPTDTTMISDSVLSPYIVPFLAISFVLLAAAIGAIVLARKD